MAKKKSNILFLSDAADGTSVTAHKGDVLCVSLTSSPTTGYRWVVEQIDEAVLRQEDADYIQSSRFKPGGRHIVGGSGQEVFYFALTGELNTQLELVYRRPWDKSAPPMRTWKIEIVIQT